MSEDSTKVITVMHSMSPPDGTTKFVVQLVDGAPSNLRLQFFSWRGAFFGSFDVFHIHWPEQIIRSRVLGGILLGPMRFLLLMLTLRLRRIPIVRTLHNVEPHERGSQLERLMLKICNDWTSLFIRLNPVTEAPGGSSAITILHGHYKDRFSTLPLPPTTSGRLLYFGLIRPYKGVDALLSAFNDLPGEDLSLRIVGKPQEPFPRLIEAAELADRRITSRLEFVEDAELVAEIGRAELVVLPYQEMHNSGSLLVALSLGRPVLAPESPSNIAIGEEVGPGWLYLYTGPLTADVLADNLRAVRDRPPGELPQLSGRDWNTIGDLHYAAYAHLLAKH